MNRLITRRRFAAGIAMYYFGFDTKGKARELLALGDDPLHFTKVHEIMIDIGPPGSIDETFAHKPFMIYHDGAVPLLLCCLRQMAA